MLDVAFPKISVVDYDAWDFPGNASTVSDGVEIKFRAPHTIDATLSP
jgi:hypothetical protein